MRQQWSQSDLVGKSICPTLYGFRNKLSQFSGRGGTRWKLIIAALSFTSSGNNLPLTPQIEKGNGGQMEEPGKRLKNLEKEEYKK
jgi:hypothetical protein